MGMIRMKRAIDDLLQRVQQLKSPLKNRRPVTTGDRPLTKPDHGGGNPTESKALHNEKPRAFISYSRKDIPFISQLDSALEMRGIETLIDREDIAKSEEWWSRIQQLIIEADTIIFALSPDSALSKICQQEVDYAESLQKRLIPIVVRDLVTHPVPKALARLNYIFFTPNAAVGANGDFDEALTELVDAIETNIGWIREHTRIGSLAARWQTLGRPDELKLRGEELSRAESWLSSRPRNAPEPTEVQRALIQESRQLALRQYRHLVGGLSAGLAVLSALTVYAFIRQQEAERQAAMALTSSAESNFQAHQELPALIDSLKAVKLLKNRRLPTAKDTLLRASLMLRQAIYESREVNRIEGKHAQSSDILSIRYSPDGKLVASGDSGDSVFLWSPEGKAHQKLTFSTQLILGLSFSPDGKYIAAIDRGNRVPIWSTYDGSQRATMHHSLTYFGPQMNLDPKLRSQPHYNDLWNKLWGKAGDYVNTSEATVDKILSKRKKNIGYDPLKSSPSGKFFVVGIGNTLEKWSMDGSFITKLGVHDGEITDIVLSPDSTIVASASKDASIRIWTSDGGFLLEVDDPRDGHKASIAALGFTQDSKRLISLDRDGTGKIWDASRFIPDRISHIEKTFYWDSPDTESPAISFTPDGKFFAAGYASGQIKFWSVDTLQPKTLGVDDECLPFDESITRFSPNGQYLVSSGCQDIRLWNAQGKLKKKILYPDMPRKPHVSFSRDSSKLLLSVGGLGKSQLFDYDGRLLKEFVAPGFVTLSPDGNHILVWDDQYLTWQTLNGTITRKIQLTRVQASDCRGRSEFSRDGSMILSQGSMVTCLVDVKAGTIRTIRPPGRAYITNSSLSHDRKTVAITNFRNVVSLYDVSRRDRLPVVILVGHTGAVDNVRLSSDGSTVITSSSRDGTIRFWQRNGRYMHSISTGNTIAAFDISPDERILLSASGNTLTAWDLDVDTLLMHGCERLRNYLNNPSTNLSDEDRRLCQA